MPHELTGTVQSCTRSGRSNPAAKELWAVSVVPGEGWLLFFGLRPLVDCPGSGGCPRAQALTGYNERLKEKKNNFKKRGVKLERMGIIISHCVYV